MARNTGTTPTDIAEDQTETFAEDITPVETAEEKLARLRGSFVKAPVAEVEVNPADAARDEKIADLENRFELFFTSLDGITAYASADAKVKMFTSLATTKSRALTVINGLTDQQLLTAPTES